MEALKFKSPALPMSRLRLITPKQFLTTTESYQRARRSYTASGRKDASEILSVGAKSIQRAADHVRAIGHSSMLNSDQRHSQLQIMQCEEINWRDNALKVAPSFETERIKIAGPITNVEELLDASKKIKSLIEDFVESLDATVNYLQGKHADGLFVPDTAFNQNLDFILSEEVEMRTFISHHNFLLASLESATSNDDNLPNTLITHRRVGEIIDEAKEDVHAFGTEKFGETPAIEVAGDLHSSLIVSAPHIHFILMELLKNSLGATVAAHGMGAAASNRSEEIPPILVDVKEHGTYLGIRVRDRGGGISPQAMERVFDYFYTSTKAMTPSYTYGGNFGATFSGLGIGLPRARLYSKFYGGDIRLSSLYGEGTDVVVHLNRLGDA